MPLNAALNAELMYESGNTRKILERVPTDNLIWTPHEKSMNMGILAQHIAAIPLWIGRILNSESFNFGTAYFKIEPPKSTAEILQLFEETIAASNKELENVKDENLDAIWSAYRGENLMFQLPKKVAIRNIAFNHLYHHRGQLSVYLRILNIPVPGMYGPSADER